MGKAHTCGALRSDRRQSKSKTTRVGHARHKFASWVDISRSRSHVRHGGLAIDRGNASGGGEGCASRGGEREECIKSVSEHDR